ncbi:tubulin binding cofactor C domain-containing protein [Ditylenchus destructor]|uniref:Tubulin binding cofactor C domain-containing protein n=1 Tax=Ditylenchus destructor TaxID=166010 RepID=A0AAD4QZQ5_9BILA|nr:tubulin binding cofactor C domain-containing protein [Ditylenchus destructor]
MSSLSTASNGPPTAMSTVSVPATMEHLSENGHENSLDGSTESQERAQSVDMQPQSEAAENGYLVDNCFANGLDRLLPFDVDSHGNSNAMFGNVGTYESYEDELYTFEEFIKAPESISSRSRTIEDSGEITAKDNSDANVENTSTNSLRGSPVRDGQGFFNVALQEDVANRSYGVPDYPTSASGIADSGNRLRFFPNENSQKQRSALYAVENQPQSQRLDSGPQSSGLSLRQAFCPTVSARSSGSVTSSTYGGYEGGGEDREEGKGNGVSSMASTYAYDSSRYGAGRVPMSEESRQYMKSDASLITQIPQQQSNGSNALNTFQNTNRRSFDDGSTVISTATYRDDEIVLGISGNHQYADSQFMSLNARNPESTPQIGYLKNPSGQNETYNRSQYTGFFVSKLLCCFSGSDDRQKRDDQYRVSDEAEHQQEKGYSWDVDRPDPRNFMFMNAADEVFVKKPGEISGQPFHLENCIDCVILLFDHISTITIDDCKNCVIVTGPVKTSVFLRDCHNCVVYTICQQFRSRDSDNIEVRIFCTTCPSIEESNRIEFSPLWMSYDGIERHMTDCGMSPFTNQWSHVHNFTPETSKYTVTTMNSASTLPSHIVINNYMNEKFRRIILMGSHGLSFYPEESYFFNYSLDKQLGAYEERALILMKSFDKTSIVKSPERMYHEAKELLKDVLRQSASSSNSTSISTSVRLLDVKDINLRPGEYETVLQLKLNHKSPGGKLIVIELAGTNAREVCANALAASGLYQYMPNFSSKCKETSQPMVEVVSGDKTDLYKTQLYRLSEIQNSV